jgi:hypothetical protein
MSRTRETTIDMIESAITGVDSNMTKWEEKAKVIHHPFDRTARGGRSARNPMPNGPAVSRIETRRFVVGM